MAIDDAEGTDAGGASGDRSSGEAVETAVAGEYTWEDFLVEYGESDAADRLYAEVDSGDAPVAADWSRIDVDPSTLLGWPPEETPALLAAGAEAATALRGAVSDQQAPGEAPPVRGLYTLEDYEAEFGGRNVADELGFEPSDADRAVGAAAARASALGDLVDERTVDVREELDEDAFFTDDRGASTIVTRYDLEKSVPAAKKSHFREEERYWVNEPYAFVIIFHSRKENEKKYYVIQPHVTELEEDLLEFLEGKLRTSIKYSEEGIVGDGRDDREDVIERETMRLLERYDIYSRPSSGDSSLGGLFGGLFGGDEGDETDDEDGSLLDVVPFGGDSETDAGDATDGWRDRSKDLGGISARPEPAVLEEDSDTLNEYQVEKLLYYLIRDFIGYERIDGIKHDINVEDISCDGYDSPVFVYHSDYEQIISNIYHGRTELDDFVVKLAQRSGKGISKRQPQVDATLPDGSRAQLTLGREVSDHGTNYTIRQFKEIPFTPIDLINWRTFSLDEMAYLWLCIENHKSLIFAGGTASGKTTSLNAVSLFIPSNSKIVSIEDTREVELPQRNWIASVTRPSFSDDDKGDIDEFDLLEAALRQRPDYIVMGEVRGEEGRTLFQVMSTGHTTYTTFHADNVGEVLKRFTTDPINVSKTMFTALDLVSIQTATRVRGRKVRRNKSLTEINHYDAENDEINVQDVYQWQAETDEFLQMGQSNTLEGIKFDRGWSQDRLEEEMFKRRVVLAYLIDRGLNTYTQVAATFQAFINDQETILALMANEELERSLEDLREMESVLIDIDPEQEAMVPRPEPEAEEAEQAREILERAEEELFPEYRNRAVGEVATALADVSMAADIEASPDEEGDVELPESTDTAGDDAASTATAADEESAVGGESEADADAEPVDVGSGSDADADEPAVGDGSEADVDAGSVDIGASDPDDPFADPFDTDDAGAFDDAAAASGDVGPDDSTGIDQTGPDGDADETGVDETGPDGDVDDPSPDDGDDGLDDWGFGEVGDEGE
jgi:flagellar protein FlaI